MYARAIDDAAERLRTLRREECEDLGLAALALGLAVAVTQVQPELAIPLFVGGLGVGALGLRALVLRWDLVDRLAGDRDAYVIPEVLAYATRETTMERRRTFAAMLRRELPQAGGVPHSRVAAVADDLEALARELEDDDLALDPVAAVVCVRLLSDAAGSPLLNAAVPAEELRARIRQIRTGLEHRSTRTLARAA